MKRSCGTSFEMLYKTKGINDNSLLENKINREIFVKTTTTEVKVITPRTILYFNKNK